MRSGPYSRLPRGKWTVIVQAMLLFSFALVLLTVASSETEAITVSGDASGAHWTLADSPVIVTGDVTVDSYLHIDPGVEVRFAQGTELHVKGDLWANGTQVNPILFTADTDTPAPGYWKGIVLNGSQDGAIKNATIEFVENAVYTRAGPRGLTTYVMFENLTVQDGTGWGIYLTDCEYCDIQDTTVERFNRGVELWNAWDCGLYRSQVYNCSFAGVVINTSADMTYINDTIFAFNEYGLFDDGYSNYDVEYCWFASNYWDVDLKSASGQNFQYNYYSRYAGADIDGDGWGDNSYLIKFGGGLSDSPPPPEAPTETDIYDDYPYCPITTSKDMARFGTIKQAKQYLGGQPGTIYVPPGVYYNGTALAAGQTVQGSKGTVITAPGKMFDVTNDNVVLSDLTFLCTGAAPEGAVHVNGASNTDLINVSAWDGPLAVMVSGSNGVTITGGTYESYLGIVASQSSALTVAQCSFGPTNNIFLEAKNLTGLDVSQINAVDAPLQTLLMLENVTGGVVDQVDTTGVPYPLIIRDGMTMALSNLNFADGTAGVHLFRTDSVDLTDSTLFNCSTGIYGDEFKNSKLMNVDLDQCPTGAFLLGCYNLTFEDVEMTSCPIGLVSEASDELYLLNLTLTDCTQGISAVATQHIRLEPLNALNSQATFLDCVDVTMVESTMNGSGAVFEGTESIVLVNDTFVDCAIGVRIGNSSFFTMTGCELLDNAFGLYVGNATWRLSPKVHDNMFIGNTEFGAYSQDGNRPFSLAYNYWGTQDPPVSRSGPAAASSRFVIDPFYRSEAMGMVDDRLIPVQYSPHDGEDINAVPDQFEWNLTQDVYGADTYAMVIINGPASATPLYTPSGLANMTYSTSGLNFPDGWYNWKVITVDKAGIEHESDYTSFTLDSTMRKPVQFEPATYATVNVLTPSFSWYAVVDQHDVTYRLVVSNNSDLSNPVIDITTTDTSYTSPVELNNFHQYYWRLHSTDSFENTNASSISTFFTDMPVLVSESKEETVGETPVESDYTYTKTLKSGDISVNTTPKDEEAYSKSSVTDVVTISADQNLTLDWINFTMSYDPADVAGFDLASLAVYRYIDFARIWVRCEHTGVDLANNLAWANVTELGTFAVWGNQYPIISTFVTPDTGLDDETDISFSAAGSYDPDDGGSSVSGTADDNLYYEWDFGDNTTAIGQEVNHTYENGTWEWTCTIIDPLGLSVQNTGTLVVEKAAVDILDNISLANVVVVNGVQPRQVVQDTVALSVDLILADNLTIDHVDYIINDEVVYTATEYPWGYDWDTTELDNGNHTLRVDVVLSDDSTESKELFVFVNNPAAATEEPLQEIGDAIAGTTVIFGVGMAFVFLDKLVQFLFGLGAEVAEEKLKSKAKDEEDLKARKNVLLTSKEYIALIIAVAAIGLAYTYSEMVSNIGTRGLGLFGYTFVHMPGFDGTEFLIALPSAIITGALVIVGMELMESFASRRQGIWSEVRLWPMGFVSLLITSALFLMPFGYPARCHSSEDGTIKQRGFVATCLPLVIMSMLLPFALLSYVPVIGAAGSIGMTLALMLLCYSVIPIKPLEGRDILKWSPPIWMVLFGSALCLFLFWVLFETFAILYAVVGALAIFSIIGLFYFDKTATEEVKMLSDDFEEVEEIEEVEEFPDEDDEEFPEEEEIPEDEELPEEEELDEEEEAEEVEEEPVEEEEIAEEEEPEEEVEEKDLDQEEPEEEEEEVEE